MKKTLICFLFIAILTRTVTAQVWSGELNGIDSIWNVSGVNISPIFVQDIYNFEDSILYIGGGFYYANSAVAHGIVSWNTDTINTYQEGVEIGGGKSNNKI